LPRRYHRPPTVKRRKPRRPGAPSPFEEAVTSDGAAVAEPAAEEFTDEEWEDDGEFEDEEVQAALATATGASTGPTRDASKHIQRDYSYVRTELTRILMVAAVLIVALVITAILR
jgi:hypothetical protein